MADIFDNPHLSAARARAVAAYHSQRVRKWSLIAAGVLVVYGLLGFFAAPPIIRGQIQQRASTELGRQVTLAAVHLNPYTLRLALDRLHIAGRAGQPDFIDVDQAVINVSWTSLFRMAPVLDALTLQRPRIRIVRMADGHFNFSDILDRFAAKPTDPDALPARYSLSNISVHDGDIAFDDQLKNASHQVDHLELGIPFIANLPRDSDIYVQPLLAMRVDGSPIRIAGKTRLFASDRESVLDFRFERLDLPRYLGYVPTKLPFAVPKGLLGGNLQLHFVQTASTPQVQLTGNLQFDDFTLDSSRQQPIISLKHGSINLADVQPLLSRYHFGAMQFDGAQLYYTQTVPGHGNFDSFTAASAPAASKHTTPTDLRIASLALRGSAIRYTDADQHQLDLGNLHGSIQGLSLPAAPPAKLDLAAQLDGGDIRAKGTLDLAASKLSTALTLKQVGLAALQGVAALPLDRHAAQGKLDATGALQLDWGKVFNLVLANTHVTTSDFALQPEARNDAIPVAWQKLDVAIDEFDLTKRTAKLGAITANGLKLDVQRHADQRINLLGLYAGKPTHSAKADKSPPWHWNIARVGFDNATVDFTDHAVAGKPVQVKLDALGGGIDGLSDRLDAPSTVKLSGAIDRGTFSMSGKLWPSPLRANLHVEAHRLDITAFEPYVGVPLNVITSRAQITSNGEFHYDARGASPALAYRGNAALENVRIRDKLTGDDFLRWRRLDAANLDASLGTDAPHVRIGNLTLDAFYARMIINADGRLNVSDVIAQPTAAPVSVTRANPGQTAAGRTSEPQSAPAIAAPTQAPAATTAATVATSAPAVDVQIGGIRLERGQLNFTDDFIKPNYTANLTELHGKIGAFGTTPNAPPAPLDLQAALNDNAPVAIDGSINPLQPVAALDIKGQATGVELTRMSAYSTKYTGYPITDGKLTANVHYVLDQRKLNADNHIFITQLTFGARDESPGIKHLPVKLAVALLKDSQGNIDVDLPVTGSLEDPQFSVGGLVWRALANLIGKAVTAPFRLLGAAFGGGHGEDLDYVAFAPGSAVLDKDAQARLGKIVAMLDKKPALVLDLTGRVDPAQDESGLRKVTVENLVRRAKLLDTQGRHADTSPASLAAVKVVPDEYEKYLKRAYKGDDIKDKPRNFLGLKKSPPPDEMRSMMEANVPTGAAAMRELADQRATAVRAWLKGKLADQRIVVEPPKLTADGIDDKGRATRVQLGLHQ